MPYYGCLNPHPSTTEGSSALGSVTFKEDHNGKVEWGCIVGYISACLESYKEGKLGHRERTLCKDIGGQTRVRNSEESSLMASWS